MNGLSSAASECIAYMVAGYIFKIIGLKGTLVLSYLISLTGMLGLILINTKNNIVLSLLVLVL
jgi:hypothetical protein